VAEAVKVKVPNFVNKDIDDAQDLAAATGVNLVRTEEASDTVAADKVIRQNPAPNAEVAKGSDVAVVVSSGKDKVAVPDVGGDSSTDAANALGQAGFKTKTIQEASSTVDEGKVIRTDPAAGDRIDKGSTVTMVVSSGPEQISVPNVLGKTGEEAKAEIEAAGLVYKEAATAPSNADQDGKVVQQNPSGGTKVEKGTTVTVRLGKASVVTTSTPGSTTSTTA
jgi:serine/threonine-protein kinase